MEWDGSATSVLESLCRMVPETIRELAKVSAHDESELAATARAADRVMPEDVVRGWIRTTPPEQRDGLIAVIEDLGFDPELFADDLESAEGWGEEEEEGSSK